MKFISLAAIIASASASGSPDWSKCTGTCSSKGWICCDLLNEAGGNITGTRICTDPTVKGRVPQAGGDYVGEYYHCSADQHKDTGGGTGADAASGLAAGVAAAVVSTYLLA